MKKTSAMAAAIRDNTLKKENVPRSGQLRQ
jgi:hypothetical protein